MISAGIDAGSRAIKIVLYDSERAEVLASGLREQGIGQDGLVSQLFSRLLAETGTRREDVTRVVGTGYGRGSITAADTTITEISCHAAGVNHLRPDAASVIDIGGQDSKVIRTHTDGTVRDFVMNDRCAAGTGRFLEVLAQRLRMRIEALGTMAAQSSQPCVINSTCVVFAETEIVGLLASGEKPENIAAGIQQSIAGRVAAMAGRTVSQPVIFTGGVARVPGMAVALERALGCPVEVAPDPQFTGALGAALLAAQ